MTRQCVSFNGNESSSGLTSKQVAQTITAALTLKGGAEIAESLPLECQAVSEAKPALTKTKPVGECEEPASNLLEIVQSEENATKNVEENLSPNEALNDVGDDGEDDVETPAEESRFPMDFSEIFRQMMRPTQTSQVAPETLNSIVSVLALEKTKSEVRARITALGVDLDEEAKSSADLKSALMKKAITVASNINDFVEEQDAVEDADKQISEKQAELKMSSVTMMADMAKTMEEWMVSRYVKAGTLTGKTMEEAMKIMEAASLRETHEHLTEKISQLRQVVQTKIERLTPESARLLVDVTGAEGYNVPPPAAASAGVNGDDLFDGSEELDLSGSSDQTAVLVQGSEQEGSESQKSEQEVPQPHPVAVAA